MFHYIPDLASTHSTSFLSILNLNTKLDPYLKIYLEIPSAHNFVFSYIIHDLFNYFQSELNNYVMNSEPAEPILSELVSAVRQYDETLTNQT